MWLRRPLLQRDAEADVPAERVTADGRVADLATDRLRETKPAPAELRDPDLGPAATQLADREVAALRQPEALAATLALEPRAAAEAREVPPIRRIQVAERLLQALRDRVLTKPLEPFAALETGQLAHLLHAPHSRPPQLPCHTSLPKRSVPHRPPAARDPRRLPLLPAGQL